MAIPVCYGDKRIMTKAMLAGLYPYFNSVAGLHLTEDDYRCAGVQGAAYSLARLLMRPGIDALATLGTWRAKLDSAWPIIIDARGFSLSKDGQQLHCRNDYDGSLLRVSVSKLCAQLKDMQVDAILWPYAVSGLAVENAASTPPWYFSLAHETSAFESPNHSQRFLVDDHISMDNSDYSTASIVSDKPVQDALNGMLYHEDGTLDITDPLFMNAHQVLDETCGCTACTAGLTRAYFHHLFVHTPLLCQRFLGMHNLFFLSKNKP